MNSQAFQVSRQQLGKTQKQLSDLLGTSLKAVQSFEQGWRKVPVHIERQILFLLASQGKKTKRNPPCWDIQHCSPERRQSCPAWEYHIGHLCWFINGTICHGKPHKTWNNKMNICRRCKVFKNNLDMTGFGETSI